MNRTPYIKIFKNDEKVWEAMLLCSYLRFVETDTKKVVDTALIPAILTYIIETDVLRYIVARQTLEVSGVDEIWIIKILTIKTQDGSSVEINMESLDGNKKESFISGPESQITVEVDLGT